MATRAGNHGSRPEPFLTQDSRTAHRKPGMEAPMNDTPTNRHRDGRHHGHRFGSDARTRHGRHRRAVAADVPRMRGGRRRRCAGRVAPRGGGDRFRLSPTSTGRRCAPSSARTATPGPSQPVPTPQRPASHRFARYRPPRPARPSRAVPPSRTGTASLTTGAAPRAVPATLSGATGTTAFAPRAPTCTRRPVRGGDDAAHRAVPYRWPATPGRSPRPALNVSGSRPARAEPRGERPRVRPGPRPSRRVAPGCAPRLVGSTPPA
jgi:hypothetical protein